MKFDSDVRRLLTEHMTTAFADASGRLLARPEPGAESFVVLGPIPLPVTVAGRTVTFKWYTFARDTISSEGEALSKEELLVRLSGVDDLPNSVLVLGDLRGADAPLIRIHSCCATGDIFGSQRCECGPQLRRAQQMVADEGVGAIVYLADHEGRGIGLFAKAAAYLLQDRGFDTYEANRKLGFPDDVRNFSEAAFIINFLRGMGEPVRLISNNPEKKVRLEGGGGRVLSMVPLVTGLSRHNLRYLQSKRAHGHLLSEREIVMRTLESDESDGRRVRISSVLN